MKKTDKTIYVGYRDKTPFPPCMGDKTFVFFFSGDEVKFLNTDGTIDDASQWKFTKEIAQSGIDGGTYVYLTAEEFNPHFPHNQVPVDSEYVGVMEVPNGKVVPWKAPLYLTDNIPATAIFSLGTDECQILYSNGKQTKSYWTKDEFEKNIRIGYYGYLSVEDAEEFLKRRDQYVASVKRLATVLDTSPTPTIKSMSLSIRKSALYFNETTRQVERVLTIQDGALVWTSRHKQEAKPYSKSTFRIATKAEVDNYLVEAK